MLTLSLNEMKRNGTETCKHNTTNGRREGKEEWKKTPLRNSVWEKTQDKNINQQSKVKRF